MSNIEPNTQEDFYRRICDILTAARTGVARTVNTAQVLSNWLIGREIVEAEQEGKHRADYGENLLKNLAQQLKQDFGAGYSYSNLKYIRQFYLVFPRLLASEEIGHALRDRSLSGSDLVQSCKQSYDARFHNYKEIASHKIHLMEMIALHCT
jgi:DUF1016 N-terminal domain